MWYNIFILQVQPMHHSERNLDVRVGIMPTIHPIYRRNNLENNLQNNGINFTKQPVVFENKPTIAITKAKARATAKATAKAITKENLSSCQADKPPREKLSFLGQDDSCQETDGCTGGFCVTLGTPPQLRAGRVRSSGYCLKSGVTGGCYPPLQGVGKLSASAMYHTGCMRYSKSVSFSNACRSFSTSMPE